jgi:hypothetical protein
MLSGSWAVTAMPHCPVWEEKTRRSISSGACASGYLFVDASKRNEEPSASRNARLSRNDMSGTGSGGRKVDVPAMGLQTQILMVTGVALDTMERNKPMSA